MAVGDRYSIQGAPDELLKHTMYATRAMSEADPDQNRRPIWKEAHRQAADEWSRRQKARSYRQAADDSEQEAASHQAAIEDVMEKRRKQQVSDLLEYEE